jgi:hypothetical protein
MYLYKITYLATNNVVMSSMYNHFNKRFANFWVLNTKETTIFGKQVNTPLQYNLTGARKSELKLRRLNSLSSSHVRLKINSDRINQLNLNT